MQGPKSDFNESSHKVGEGRVMESVTPVQVWREDLLPASSGHELV